VGPRAGLDGCGKSRPPPGFDPRTVQPRSESLYRLRCPGPHFQRNLPVVNEVLRVNSISSFSLYVCTSAVLRRILDELCGPSVD